MNLLTLELRLPPRNSRDRRTWFSISTGVVLILGAIILQVPATLLPATNQVSEARQLLDRGEFAQARALLERFPRAEQSTELRFELGRLYFLWGEIDKAVDLLEEVTQSDSTKSDYFLWLGRAMGRKAEKAFALKAPFLARKARDAFQRAVELDPANLDARDDLLDYYLNAPGFLGGGRDKAMVLVEGIRSTNPVKYHLQLSQVYLQEKSFNQAEQAIQEAIRANPSDRGGYDALAEFYEQRGKLEEARKVLLKTVQLFANSPEAHFLLGRFEVRVGGDRERGRLELETFLKSYISQPPYPFEGHYWMGKLFLKMGQPQEASTQFKQALQAFPAHALSLEGLAEAQRLDKKQKGG